jgi:uncharacterized protein YcfJ
MKTIAALSATALTLVGAASAATPSFAQPYGYGAYETCRAKKSDSGTTGAVIGGLAGVVLGSQVAGRGDRTEGAVIGGLAGVLLGNTVGRSSAKSSDACEARNYRAHYRRAYYDRGGDYDRYDRFGARNYGYGYRD